MKTIIPLNNIIIEFDIVDMSFFNGYLLLWFTTLYVVYVYNLSKRTLSKMSIGNIFYSCIELIKNVVIASRLATVTLNKRREKVIKAYDYLNGKLRYKAFYKL